MGSVYHELTTVLNTIPKPGETGEQLAKRLALSVNRMPDEEWKSLSNEAQKWVEQTLKNNDANAPLSPPPGYQPPEPEGEGDVQPHTAVNGGEPKAKPATKKAAPKKAPAKAKTATSKKPKTEARGRKGSFDVTHKIHILAKENPRRKGTAKYKMFEKYRNGMTVQQALDAGIKWGNMRADVKRGNIRID